MKASRGYALVEVVVAVLLTAVITTSVFSVALTAKRSGARAERKLAAAYASRLLLESLKNYVTMDAPPYQYSSRAPGGSWRFPGDLSSYALAKNGNAPITCPDGPLAGAHNADSLVPAGMAGPPYGMTLRYYVYEPDHGPGDPNYRPSVQVCAHWTEPP